MIDVIIPAYNCQKTLGRTLSSLVAQTDNNFKVVIVNDKSQENIDSIVDEYSKRLDINYIKNEKNLGCGMSRQVGIDNATNSHFTFLDSDDMFMPYTVETFNSIIEADPDTQFVHSYFYQQVIISGDSALQLMKEGYTWCHGKLYNAECIRKYDIHNSPLVKYADDSYFNSMCSELLEMKIVRLPLVLWTNTETSITRKVDSRRDETAMLDLLNALYMSSEHVLKYKSSVSHLTYTLEKITESLSHRQLSNDELIMFEKLKELTQKG